MKQELQKQIDQFKDQLRALSDKVNGLPEQEFEKDKWYVDPDTWFMIRYSHTKEGSGYTEIHGQVIYNDKWKDSDYLANKEMEKRLRHTTPSEVQEALTKEAVNRGFKPDCFFRQPWENNRVKKATQYCYEFEYRPLLDALYFRGDKIYLKGQWAEIVKDQPITICGKVVNYDNDCGLFSVDGQNYLPEDLRVLAKLMQKGQIKSLNVGCNGQEKVDLQLIEQLINRINKG